ncbi:uncharacterized protein MONBRDRAFT_32475 [Monosiga brevicollis MX1]|uniref:PH domain-containing protein n=1 Tax=Monosiga brevicollis TaxID=81824 RepID=A9UZR0_MONBE|nr:uncharacterized protein MONBRDRAFT_32475 [Monosiga brevicollis MX1]EDQ89275.1 predicted protein [Monosiga brevicollis MX1]|eukprot:XP_001745851.1 hypothetical protein [Monosiga brevicollis MX1]
MSSRSFSLPLSLSLSLCCLSLCLSAVSLLSLCLSAVPLSLCCPSVCLSVCLSLSLSLCVSVCSAALLLFRSHLPDRISSADRVVNARNHHFISPKGSRLVIFFFSHSRIATSRAPVSSEHGTISALGSGHSCHPAHIMTDFATFEDLDHWVDTLQVATNAKTLLETALLVKTTCDAIRRPEEARSSYLVNLLHRYGPAVLDNLFLADHVLEEVQDGTNGSVRLDPVPTNLAQALAAATGVNVDAITIHQPSLNQTSSLGSILVSIICMLSAVKHDDELVRSLCTQVLSNFTATLQATCLLAAHSLDAPRIGDACVLWSFLIVYIGPEVCHDAFTGLPHLLKYLASFAEDKERRLLSVLLLAQLATPMANEDEVVLASDLLLGFSTQVVGVVSAAIERTTFLSRVWGHRSVVLALSHVAHLEPWKRTLKKMHPNLLQLLITEMKATDYDALESQFSRESSLRALCRCLTQVPLETTLSLQKLHRCVSCRLFRDWSPLTREALATMLLCNPEPRKEKQIKPLIQQE